MKATWFYIPTFNPVVRLFSKRLNRQGRNCERISRVLFRMG